MSNEYDGVVYLKNTGVLQATGALLWTGKHIITAAHFVDGISDWKQIEIGFNSQLNLAPLEISSINIHPGWENDASGFNHDIVIIELASAVDSSINRYQIYRDYDEIGQNFIRIGYSAAIDPVTGIIVDPNKIFRSGSNHYDTTTDQVNPLFGSSILENYQLSYDFDDGSSEHDAYGRILGIDDLGTGSSEGFSNPGDSGGPAFINNQIAGIVSYIFRYESSSINPDITSETDSSYGELASDTRVSKYSDWIDSVVLTDDFVQNIPDESEGVDLFPVEGDKQNTINYFLLEISQPLLVDSGVVMKLLTARL